MYLCLQVQISLFHQFLALIINFYLTVVYADVMKDTHDPSRSKGCGVVEFERSEEALIAIQTMNDVEVSLRVLITKNNFWNKVNVRSISDIYVIATCALISFIAKLDGRPLFIREDREDRELAGNPRNSRGNNSQGGRNSMRSNQQGYSKRTKMNSSMNGVGNAIGVGGPVTVGRRVYVANISWETSWQDLKDHFRQVGNVVYSDIMVDGSTGRSKGCGIVEYETPEEALRAISQLSNSELQGRSLLVREDREDREYGTGAGNGGHLGTSIVQNQGGGVMQMQGQQVGTFSGNQPQGSNATSIAGRQIVVQNLPWTVTWKELKDSFRQCGNVVRADVMLDDQGRSKGFGTVCFDDPQEAGAAIQMFNEQDFGGRVITVRLDKFAQ